MLNKSISSDGKRPDGLSITPWDRGRPLVWDVTCWDTYAPSHLHHSASGPGILADLAARTKIQTYKEIGQTHIFVPVAVETSGALGKDALNFLHQLALRIRSSSHDPLEYLKLCQKISVCIQNYNCASILGCSASS